MVETPHRRWPRWLEDGLRCGPALALGLGLLLFASRLWIEKWISDDGYIYLVYVKNLFEHGELAFNLGERVDAATGFAWLMALIAGKAALFFLDYRQVAFVLSWACALLAFWVLARRVLAGERRFLIAIALVFFTHFVVSFSTSGLETPLILLLSVLVYDRGRVHFRSAAMAMLLGAAPFIRPELGVLLLVYWVCLLRRLDGRCLAISAGTAIALALGRWLCFGDVLPNTAFIKLLSPTYGQGRWYFEEFFASYWYFAVLCAAFVAIGGWLVHHVVRRRRLPEGVGEQHVFIIVCTLLLFAYVWASGGDFMHGRFFLPQFVFVTLLVVDLGPRLLPIARGSRAQAAVPVAAFAAAVVASMATSYALRADDNWFHKINDEQAMTAASNPRVTAWDEPNLHRWAEQGRRLNRLAARVGRPVGDGSGPIGQLGYYRDADRVYVFDVLGLTQIAGSLLDTGSYFRRIGHNVRLPPPLQYVEPRMTLGAPPDPKLGRLLRFAFEGENLVLGALRDVDAYVAAGLLPAGTWARIDARIGALLDDEWIDRNVLFYLRHRYPEDRPLFARIRRAYDEAAADGSRSWITWYERHKALLDEARAMQRGDSSALPARYGAFLEGGSLKPIDNIYQDASWATKDRRCPLDLTRGTRSADEGVTVEWQTSAGGTMLRVENDGGALVGWAHIDLEATVKEQCGADVKDVVLDWTVREVAGDHASHFFLSPLEDKQAYFVPGPQLKAPLARKGKPLGLHFPLRRGQRYLLSLEAVAVAPGP